MNHINNGEARLFQGLVEISNYLIIVIVVMSEIFWYCSFESIFSKNIHDRHPIIVPFHKDFPLAVRALEHRKLAHEL